MMCTCVYWWVCAHECLHETEEVFDHLDLEQQQWRGLGPGKSGHLEEQYGPSFWTHPFYLHAAISITFLNVKSLVTTFLVFVSLLGSSRFGILRKLCDTGI